MLNVVRIGTKITVLLLTVVLASVLTISFLAYNLGKKAIDSRYRQTLTVISNLKAGRIENIFEQLERNMDLVAKNEEVIESLRLIRFINENNRDSIYSTIDRTLDNYLLPIQNTYEYKNIILIDANGNTAYLAKQNKIEQGSRITELDEIRENATNEPYYGEVITEGSEEVVMNTGIGIYDKNSNLLGYLVIKFNMSQVYEITQETVGLRESGEVIIGQLSGTKVKFLNKPRHSSEKILTQNVILDDPKSEAIQNAVKGNTGNGYSTDYKKTETLAAWIYLNKIGWGMVVKIDKSEIDRDLDELIKAFLLAGLVIAFIAFAIARVFSNVLINPLLRLKTVLHIMTRGELPEQVKKGSNDEIGEMSSAVINLTENLRRNADFARKIGEEQYDTEFSPAGDNDTLGSALITMRDNIRNADQKDKERNWIVTNIAEIGQILREHNQLDQLGDSILAFMTEKIGAVQGALYITDEIEGDLKPEDMSLSMVASYAYNKKKYLKASYRFAEGLVGQTAIEQETILRTEIPEDYVTVTSGILGDKKPTCLLLVPLVTDEKVYGVIEFAGLERFSETAIQFAEETSIIIARTIFNIRVNERTVKLLRESQTMSKELQNQQEVLRNNAEEMAATQEELKRANTRLEEQILEVNRTQKRMQVLLENASEIITIYEPNGNVRYISPSVESILGYSPDDVIGVNDISNVHPKSKATVKGMFESLNLEPDQTVTIQFEYRKKDGETVWLEATGVNRTSDPAIRGLVVNSRDITERRRAEKEARMRGQMQSLSENSPDLIMRLNKEGVIFYINPTIKAITGEETPHFLNTHIRKTELKGGVANEYLELKDEVSKSKKKAKRELTFNTLTGDRVMQVNAIPEENDKKEVESVLFVSHDITERKKREVEIREYNRKISESINYAKRIQSAIMPDTKNIQEVLPKSFIFYKPRDVVSGDFPWYKEQGDNIYIAVVDCTGHGVPGALISLIGYFILNNIISTEGNLSPGAILDKLNTGVTKTLRQQDLGAKTKDGMDVALCKINRKEKTLEYAGAHRPLYFVPEDTEKPLHQIKGDRMPIGGGERYRKKRTEFKTTRLEYQEGDAVYIFSDGLPDQFGGPDNRKFSPHRIRELIELHRTENMPEIREKFEEVLSKWKADFKQTDDILLIGIKF